MAYNKYIEELEKPPGSVIVWELSVETFPGSWESEVFKTFLQSSF